MKPNRIGHALLFGLLVMVLTACAVADQTAAEAPAPVAAAR